MDHRIGEWQGRLGGAGVLCERNQPLFSSGWGVRGGGSVQRGGDTRHTREQEMVRTPPGG